MKVALGVSGGIACYKSAEILRRLQDRGVDVVVLMTKGATQFVTPLTFRALSGNKVYVDIFEGSTRAAISKAPSIIFLWPNPSISFWSHPRPPTAWHVWRRGSPAIS